MHARRLAVLSSLLLCLCALRPGPAASAVPAGPQDRVAAFRSDVELVLHSIAVLDSSGEPVTGLTREDFHLAEDGVAQEISLFLAPNATPLDVALVLDSSNSLSFWASSVRRAAKTFLRSLEPEDCVYLLPFNENVGPGTWARAIDPMIGRRIDAIFMRGGTSLYDAVFDALEEIDRSTTGAIVAASQESSSPAVGGPAPTEPSPVGSGLDRAALGRAAAEQASQAVSGRARCGATPVAVRNGGEPLRRRAAVLLTDGADQASRRRFDEVLDLARQASIPIFPVVVGEARSDERLRATLDALAGNTGGSVIETVAADQLAGAYADVVALLRASYLVGYRATENDEGIPRWREMNIRSRRPSYRLVHRDRYFR